MILSATAWLAAAAALLAAGGLFVLLTRFLVRRIEAAHPPIGRLLDIGGRRIHVVDRPAADPSAPAIIVLHGTVSSLFDSIASLAEPLAGLGRLVFIDRPGHGYSSRLPGDEGLGGQTAVVAGVMDALGIERAVLVGHSYGGAVAAAFAVLYPERTAGLVLIAPATHPWPGAVALSYRLIGGTISGPLFAQTLTTPIGLVVLDSTAARVFAPEPVPTGYRTRSAIELALRPSAFQASAAEIGALKDELVHIVPRYGEIRVPTVVVAGGGDRVVSTDLHARAFAAAVPNARLVLVDRAGHGPQYTRGADIAAEVRRVIEASGEAARQTPASAPASAADASVPRAAASPSEAPTSA